VDRAGALARIREIKESKQPDRKNTKKKALQQDQDEENGNRQKLNIFDAQDSTVLKHETLARIGLDDQIQED
jgi:hypothetical protein